MLRYSVLATRVLQKFDYMLGPTVKKGGFTVMRLLILRRPMTCDAVHRTQRRASTTRHSSSQSRSIVDRNGILVSRVSAFPPRHMEVDSMARYIQKQTERLATGPMSTSDAVESLHPFTVNSCSFSPAITATRRTLSCPLSSVILRARAYGSPQISLAISLTNPSFFFSSSSVRGYPDSWVLKPHCGLTAICLSASSLVWPVPSATYSAAL